MFDSRYSKYEPIFGAWYITNKIGQGSAGQVYEIEREELGVKYKAALKAVTIPDSPEEIQEALFNGVAKEDLPAYFSAQMEEVVSEYQYLAKLKGHSNIMNYEDHQVIRHEDGIGWDILIKTELLTPLVDHSISNRLSEEEVVRLGIDMCKALEFCRKFGIVHRDIKPDNIFVSENGGYKLGDFGVAKEVEKTQYSISRKGTYSYMAPEVFHGDAYGPSSDVYSLGLVLYKYVNHNRNPFMPRYPEKIQPDDSDKAFVKRMSTKILPVPDEASAALTKVILKACAYNSGDRYRRAEHMRKDLEVILSNIERKKSGVTDSADSMPLSSRLELISLRWRTSKSLRMKVLGIILAAVICAGGAGYAMIPKDVTDITGLDEGIELYYDGSHKLDCSIEPEWFKDEPISFKSSDEKVFTVSEEGIITAHKIGTAKLSASAKEYTETVDIAVVPKVTKISGVEEGYTLVTGSSFELAPVLSPEKFAKEEITYKSSDEAVVTVTDKGVVTATSDGDAKITISAGGCKKTVKISTYTPVVVQSTPKKTNSNKKPANSNSKKTSNSNGYFKSSDDEYF